LTVKGLNVTHTDNTYNEIASCIEHIETIPNMDYVNHINVFIYVLKYK